VRPFLKHLAVGFVAHDHARAIAPQQRCGSHPASSQTEHEHILVLQFSRLHASFTSISASPSPATQRLPTTPKTASSPWSPTTRAVRSDGATAPSRRFVCRAV